MKKFVHLVLLCCFMFLTACGRGTDASPSEETDSETAVTFTDDLGRQVTADRPERVVCLIGSFADIWYLAGGYCQ